MYPDYDLENCPICNYPVDILGDNNGKMYIECQRCGLRTKEIERENQLLELWNNRPRILALEEAVEYMHKMFENTDSAEFEKIYDRYMEIALENDRG